MDNRELSSFVSEGASSTRVTVEFYWLVKLFLAYYHPPFLKYSMDWCVQFQEQKYTHCFEDMQFSFKTCRQCGRPSVVTSVSVL